MESEGMVKAVFYLPLVDNDETDLSSQSIDVEERCFVAFGAWTKMGFFKGVWRMESGAMRIDTCAVYAIVMEKERLSELERILHDFVMSTTQEAVYLEVEHDVDMRLIKRNPRR